MKHLSVLRKFFGLLLNIIFDGISHRKVGKTISLMVAQCKNNYYLRYFNYL